MSLDTPAKRLQWARQKQGKFGSPTDAARAYGWTVSTYLGHENGDRNPSIDAAKRYAQAYRVRWEWLIEGDGAPTLAAERGVQLVPVLDLVHAGELSDPGNDIPVEGVPLMTFANLGRGDFFATKVVGDAMDRISPSGSIILINRADRDLTADKSYVFSLGGEPAYRIWQPDPPHLAPFSTNPVHKPIFIRGHKGFDVVGRVVRTVLDL